MMKSAKKEGRLCLRLYEDWTWTMSHELEELAKGENDILIQMENVRWVDSECIRTLCKWVKQGKSIELQNPPKVYNRVVEILELDELLAPIHISESKD